MSDRGAFCTEFMYCQSCFEELREHLVTTGYEGVVTVGEHPTLGGILAGALRSLGSDQEFWAMVHVLTDMGLSGRLCHPVTIAILGETRREIITIPGRMASVARQHDELAGKRPPA